MYIFSLSLSLSSVLFPSLPLSLPFDENDNRGATEEVTKGVVRVRDGCFVGVFITTFSPTGFRVLRLGFHTLNKFCGKTRSPIDYPYDMLQKRAHDANECRVSEEFKGEEKRIEQWRLKTRNSTSSTWAGTSIARRANK